MNLDISKFEIYKGNFIQQQIHHEVINQINRAAILSTNPEEIFKNIAKNTTNFSLLGLRCSHDKEYKQTYLFMDVAENLLAQYEGICQRLNEMDANARKLFNFPIETLKEWGNEYKNSVISIAKAVSFCVLNLPDFSEWANDKTEMEKIKAVQQLGKEISAAYNHIYNELSEMSPKQLNKNIGYLLTDLIFSGVKTKLAGKVLTMSGQAIKTSVQRGAKICNDLGICGNESAQLVGTALKNGIEATGQVLDIAKKEQKAISSQGEIVKYVQNTFEKDKKHIANLMEIKNNFKLSAAKKIALTNSAYQLKNTAEAVAKHFNCLFLKEAQNLKGWRIDFRRGTKAFTIRIMDGGSGQRIKPYFRISVNKVGTLDAMGSPCSNRALTHINLEADYLKQIDNIINTYLKK